VGTPAFKPLPERVSVQPAGSASLAGLRWAFPPIRSACESLQPSGNVARRGGWALRVPPTMPGRAMPGQAGGETHRDRSPWKGMMSFELHYRTNEAPLQCCPPLRGGENRDRAAAPRPSPYPDGFLKCLPPCKASRYARGAIMDREGPLGLWRWRACPQTPHLPQRRDAARTPGILQGFRNSMVAIGPSAQSAKPQ
jgi:hypothetical protein